MTRSVRDHSTKERRALPRTLGAGIVALCCMTVVAFASGADAAIVPTVPLGTSANFSVLAGSAVTNTGPSVLAQSVGVSPGTSITGIGAAPDGVVLAPGTIESATAVAALAKSDLTTAYNNAAGRSVDATTAADLGNLVLAPGVYAGPGPGKGALSITGPLVLDGQGDASAVFIFQTDSTLITATGSSVSLINGAQECNVFWQVGSSATLGSGSMFVGNILALTSITIGTGVTVRGRALAQNGAVTLQNDVFTSPTCAQPTPATTTTVSQATTTTVSQTTTTAAGGPATTVSVPLPSVPTDITLPATGGTAGTTSALSGLAILVGGLAIVLVRRRRDPASS